MRFISPYVSHTSLLFMADTLPWESKDIKVSRPKIGTYLLVIGNDAAMVTT